MKIRHLVWIRRFTQAFFLGLFVVLLVLAQLPRNVDIDYSQSFSEAQHTGESETPSSPDIRISQPVALFFHMDPLVWLSSVISTRHWMAGFGWAIIILVATLFSGRFFCGFICPFGTLHHMVGAIRPTLGKKQTMQANQTVGSRRIKYFLLIMI